MVLNDLSVRVDNGGQPATGPPEAHPTPETEDFLPHRYEWSVPHTGLQDADGPGARRLACRFRDITRAAQDSSQGTSDNRCSHLQPVLEFSLFSRGATPFPRGTRNISHVRRCCGW